MKKVLFTIIAFTGIAIGIKAQDITESDSIALLKSKLEYVSGELTRIDAENQKLAQEKKWNGIWGKGRYTMLAYSLSSSVTAAGVKTKADISVALAKGNQYFFNKRPFGDIVKIGLDVRWFDLNFVKYKNTEYEITDGWIEGNWSDGIDADLGFLDRFANLGIYDVHISAFGIGPVVSIAPFSHLNNAARYFRTTLYFHYRPTFGMHLVSDDGEIETSMAYCNMMDFGGKFQYRYISLGLESNWGNGKYSQISSYFESDDKAISPKKRKFSNFRIYIAFAF